MKHTLGLCEELVSKVHTLLASVNTSKAHPPRRLIGMVGVAFPSKAANKPSCSRNCKPGLF